MSSLLIDIFRFSIVIAAVIGWIRIKKIDPAYYPFIYCLWIGALNECISSVIVELGYYSSVNNNIYVLLESLLISWQFRKWGLFQASRYLFTGIITILCLFWITENFFISKIIYISSYFRIFYSFIIALFSIHTINWLIIRERKSILKNSIFLICIGFVIYFTYKILVEAFWVYGLNNGSNFRQKVYDIMVYINLFSNLIYALAVLWMPAKQRFSLPY